MPTITTGTLREVRKLGERIGRRGACLLFLFLLDIIYSFGLRNPTPRSLSNPTTVYLMGMMPLGAWSVLWFVVGLVCLVFAFVRRDYVGFGCAIALKVFFALVFLMGWLAGAVERGYLSSVIWGGFAFLIFLIAGWRENNEH